MDKLWGWVNHKDMEQWVWLTLNVKIQGIVGVYIGRRAAY
jgi:hypothetical protein